LALLEDLQRSPLLDFNFDHMKRTLYKDEVPLKPTAGCGRLERDLAELARRLAAFVGERVRVPAARAASGAALARQWL